MKEGKKKKIVVGLSGGMDSSVALLLLKKQNWQPIGVSLELPVWKSKENFLRENICCSEKSLNIAKKVCQRLNIPYYIFDVRKEFRKEVIGYFIKELKDNKTPNPCVICNRYLKFKKLFEWAKKHGVKYVATGHYARIVKNQKSGKYELLKAKDKEKDQTYFLSFLPQTWLKYIIFPLGEITKRKVKQLAIKENLDFFIKKKQSQDFCFVSGRSLPRFLERRVGTKPGLIRNTKGYILGKHRGLHFYTIGQRKGLDIPNGPYFVKGFNEKNNILIVTKNKKDLLGTKIFLSPVHFLNKELFKKEMRVEAKIRYRHPSAKATLFPFKKKGAELVFDRAQKAITPGQFAVFYEREVCLGGGVIESVIK